MTDPRLTDPAERGDPLLRPTDPSLRDPIERDRTGGAMWGWIAGIAVLVLIAFILIGGWSGSNRATNTAANAPAAAPTTPATTGAAHNGTGPPPPTPR